MADEILLTQEEFLTYEGLETFKQLQDTEIDAKDAKVLQDAKDYFEDRVDEFDPAGKAAELVKELVEGAVADNTEAIEDLAEAKADKTQVATDIENAVKAETEAREEAVAGVQKEVDDLEQVVADNKAAVEARVKAIEDDYLVEADKTELQGNIDTLAGKVGEVAEGKTLAGLVTENAQAITTLKGEGEGSVKKAIDDAINKFATDVTDDAVVNSYKELIDWVAEHGSEAAEMAEAIQTNKTDIAELEALVGTLPEGATVTTVVELIQSLVNAEKTRAEGIEGGLDERLQAVEEAVGEGGSVETQITNAITELDADKKSADVEEGKGVQVQVVEVDGVITTVAVTGNYDNAYDAKGAAATAEANAATDATTKANQAEANAKAEVTALADGAVKTNTEAIAAINHETDGILAQAKAHADGKDEAIAEAKQAGVDAGNAVTELQNGAVKDNADAIAEIKTNMPTPISNEKIQAMFSKTEA